MIVIVGCFIVLGAVLGGFTWAGGHAGSLFHPSEILTICGSSIGALIIMSTRKVLRDLVRGMVAALKGSPYDKQMYRDLFQLSYDLLRAARRDGLLMLDKHVTNPGASSIFNKYPRFTQNHHACEFLCGGLLPIIEGVITPEQLPELLDAELRVLEEEHHAALSVLTKTADALPGFGIVAAVLGIVVTMGAIDGPVEEIGHKVGAALVGTFLGILLSYGFISPLAGRMELLGAEELSFFRTIKSIVLGASNSLMPSVTIELARRGVGTEMRPTGPELESLFRSIDVAGSEALPKSTES